MPNYLLVTTQGPHTLYHVISRRPFQEGTLEIPAGQYLFKKARNPHNPRLGSWVRLVNPQSHFPWASRSAFIGISRKYFPFWATHRSPFGDASRLDVSIVIFPINTWKKPPAFARRSRPARVPSSQRFCMPATQHRPAARRTIAVG